MSQELQGRRIAFVVANEGIELVELTRPWEAVRAAGGEPELVAPEAGQVQTMEHLDKADRFSVDRTTAEVRHQDYDAVVLPGGVANPDQLRTDRAAVDFVRDMAQAGKPVAAICHGPWTLVEGDLVAGRTLTSWPSLKTDITNAGGKWVDAEVHVDTHGGRSPLVTSRKPDDLDAFCRELVSAVERSPATARSR